MKPLLPMLVLALVAIAPLAAQDGPAPITSARGLRTLGFEQAATGRPVRIRGVITFIEPKRTIFLQDESAGTFIKMTAKLPAVDPGQLVEVEGVSYPGLYVPGIEPASLRVLGTASLPSPRAVNFEQLASGVFNYEWVEVRGVGRSVRSAADGHAVLTIALGDGRLEVHATSEDLAAAEALVDARIRLAGLAAGFINDRRQLVAPHLRVADFTAAQIEESAPAEPFALPVTPVDQLLHFHPEGTPGHRVKVRGTVTHRQPGEALFLRDGTRGLQVDANADAALEPGDVVEALGFEEMGAFTAVLRDAVVRRVGHETAPGPVRTTAAELAKGTHDADLVALDAQVVDVLRGAGEFTLVLRSGDTGFQARLGGADAAQLASLRPGSRIGIRGVARATEPDFPGVGFSARQRSCDLLLRSAADVTVLHAGPFWNAQRLAAAFGLLALGVGASLAWVISLRRRIATQTALIRTKERAEAALEERERIAREFHDTLEQELVGLMLRLDAAAAKIDTPKPRELLDGARRLVQGVQAGARSLVWNLRQPALAALDLPDAISASMAGLREGREIEICTTGPARRLPGIFEHELLRVAQEAATNAVKHGAASRIDIAIDYGPREVRLRIADNGSGFEVSRDGAKPGHFGLIGMRERVRKLGGSLTIESAPGAGARLEARVPLPD